MTGHDERATDAIDAQVDERLAAALRATRAGDSPIDRDAFLARAQVRRDRLRRRRRIWTVATPLVAAALVVVTVAFVLQRGDPSQTARHSAGSTPKPACPEQPGVPDVVRGDTLFAFAPTHLTLCTYSVDGDLVTTVDVPGPDDPDVAETLDYLQRAYVDSPADPAGPHCAAGEIAIDRLGVFATGDDESDAAWVAMAGCSTPEVTPGDDVTSEVNGPLVDVRLTPGDDTIEVRTRAPGSESWGEPNRVETPHATDSWLAHGIGLDDATVYLIVLADDATIANADEIAAVTMATPRCGAFTCALFAVPRDASDPRYVVRVSSEARVDAVALDPVPVGGSAGRGVVPTR